jgi:hypothetical protein
MAGGVFVDGGVIGAGFEKQKDIVEIFFMIMLWMFPQASVDVGAGS